MRQELQATSKQKEEQHPPEWQQLENVLVLIAFYVASIILLNQLFPSIGLLLTKENYYKTISYCGLFNI
jgi:hypothetical protein